jgi:hypothetical protein
MFNKPTGSDKESDSARHFGELPIVKGAQVIRHELPSMSDNELYLRVGIPDGLQNDGSHAEHYGIVQQAHMDPSRSPIKSDSGQ